MGDLMSADELRTAAATLRERAEVATPEGHTSPWKYTEATYGNPSDGPTHVAVTCCQGHGAQPAHFIHADDGTTETSHTAAYIATMHPGVGLALADWLDVVAERHKSDGTEELTLHLDTECSVCDDGGHEVVVCAGCYPTWDGMDGRSIYPCAEVKAALPVARLINGGAS